MRHFSYLSERETARLFHLAPQELTLDSDARLLATALGATLYCPATRPDLVKDIRKQAARGAVSMVICLEDSIADAEVPAAETNVVEALAELHAAGIRKAGDPEDLMLFIRVRTPEQLLSLAERGGQTLDVLTGFVIPKFENTSGTAQRFLDALHTVNDARWAADPGARPLRIMPILESPLMIHAETRTHTLGGIFEVLEANRPDILSVRIGATDMSSAYGLRRSRDLTIYDVKVVSAVIGDIVNMLGRPGGFVISGPVWEHYSSGERLLRPMLRSSPFADADELGLRQRLLTANLDGLIREIELDQANGLLGKTVIHPSHVPLVHAMSVISHEAYLDALHISGEAGGGAAASPYRNKMNEMKPHQAWAASTLVRAAAFGVAAPDITYVDLLEASMN
ncbi:HpcH/HpaI aldolase/citrate lyase family protein [Arthrobacter sp. zg-Y1110]|uniref:HpcH/HpaI aldolase/citrate lyase family protein n=1 Tax=Arthrobacter sp. zg-Y1110 TaxID=2886932 RepID=UPI001D15ABE5|nr:HpcH/HpaI aldolase/citrate lyase family protein [Arthrobacter sp. zg-Y1110]MCC3291805.1 HpcH/HpaI aldolase/citrate lyase family protein [Arthrobacter sp. zg-Y1110]UWX85636.1 HpcH/HpaI aldolase/citrate lyase family protein [Arthrobacter sp. zg-Y1110]